MPVGKSRNLNREKGEAGERLTQEMFGLAPTSGSGCGRFDKQDSKNDFLRVETKTTGADHYVLNLKKWELWRQQAAKARSQFFLHLIPEENGKLNWDQSLVVITEAYFMALAPDTVRLAWSHNFIEKSHQIRFGVLQQLEHVHSNIPDPLEEIDRLTTPTGSGLIVLRAPYFKELLDKDDEI